MSSPKQLADLLILSFHGNLSIVSSGVTADERLLSLSHANADTYPPILGAFFPHRAISLSAIPESPRVPNGDTPEPSYATPRRQPSASPMHVEQSPRYASRALSASPRHPSASPLPPLHRHISPSASPNPYNSPKRMEDPNFSVNRSNTSNGIDLLETTPVPEVPAPPAPANGDLLWGGDAPDAPTSASSTIPALTPRTPVAPTTNGDGGHTPGANLAGSVGWGDEAVQTNTENGWGGQDEWK